MVAITIDIPDERLEELYQLAQESGISTQDLLRASIEDWLNHPQKDFIEATNKILNQNKELYKRLA
ncbi:MAG: ribbon-helix-helix protein, CopG family [Pleurocapsa sp. MO_192.B19]|nr:ribbon-helix-helix protein, CopG family [Pleurocapsa sp. MO_192.B19]